MSRSQQDQIIEDDENETCPLCIEEFDLSDRGFKPCPCGYQICQFCYNNIKTTMNGLCPACRRPYDDKNIQWKMPTNEELMSHKENVANAAKKKAAARQKEMAKREADTLSRRHLQGIRVRQKNLVYVTGMKPTSSPEHLSEMLRRDEYFGQYGKIVKVVVSKAKEGQVNAPVGIYVTFESKESAARCIAAVDGSPNFDTKLRAQYGTTKYCSAYLRGEQCTKQGCLFLHEPGEENESFTRQDLSSMNSMHTQLPAQGNSTFGRAPHSDPPPPQQAPQTIAAAAPPMDRDNSRDGSASGVESTEAPPALPAGATWARNAPSRRASQAPSASTSSPLAQSAIPATTGPAPADVRRNTPSVPRLHSALSHEAVRPEETPADLSSDSGIPQRPLSFLNLVKDLLVDSDIHFEFDESSIDPQKLAELDAMPPLFDDNGGFRRLAALKQHETNDRKEAEAAQVTRQALSSLDLDDAADPGSLQLGGEPDEQQGPSLDQFRRHQVIQPPTTDRLTSPGPSLDNPLSPSGLAARSSAAPQGAQQQQQFLLAQLKSASPNYLNQGMPSNPPQASHARQASRFSFANDSTASASVKPVANPKLMNQQSSMMPPQHQFNAQNSSQIFASGVQGPPPGLKTSGTPSVSGGGMFGQGHGFATAGLGYSANTQARTPNDEMMRELMRARGGSAGSGQASDGGRREFMFPSSMQQISQSTSPVPAPGLSGFPYGSQAGAFPDHGQQKQKKKSKKHRHANTSSSGGGVVDHADPSILQAARMHQSGGHNPYGTQSQGQSGFSNPMMFGNTGNTGSSSSSNNNNGFGGRCDSSVHATATAITVAATAAAACQSPLHISGSWNIASSALPARLFDDDPFVGPPGLRQSRPSSQTPSRRSTPALPPGLPIPQSGTPMLDQGFWPSSGGDASQNEFILPELGKVPSASKERVDAPPNFAANVPVSASGVDDTLKPTAAVSQPEAALGLSSESFPALPKRQLAESKSKAKQPEVRADASVSVAGEKAPSKSAVGESVAQTIDTKSMKRQPPGKLDISAATGKIQDDATGEGPWSRTGTPTVETPLKRTTQPRTLRLVQTPKTETKPDVSREGTPKPETPRSGTPLAEVLTAGSAAAKSTVAAIKHPSRQPSVASINVPGTPVSEKISDNVSISTGPISRSGSPQPINRVGSAPSRSKTKSQAKKERQERAKALTEEAIAGETPTTAAEPEVMQEPILGRKKKAKKPSAAPKPKPAAAISTPTVSRPETPPVAEQPAEKVVEKASEKASEKAREKASEEAIEKPKAVSEEPVETLRPAAQDEQTKEIQDVALDALDTSASEASKKSATLLLQDILDNMAKTGGIPHATSTMELFKPLAGLNARLDVTAADLLHPPSHAPLTRDELAILDAGKPVRRGGEDGRNASRMLITPYSRKCIRGLGEDMENHLLDLERTIRESKPPYKYTHKSTNEAAAYASKMFEDVLKDMAASMLRPPTTNNVAAQQASSRGVNYGDDALAYLNQYILPMPSRGNKDANDGVASGENSIGTAIPRLYTTGDPTYSVSGVDNTSVNVNAVPSAAANAAAAAAAITAPTGLELALSGAKSGDSISGTSGVGQLPFGYRPPNMPEMDHNQAMQTVANAAEQLAKSVRSLTGSFGLSQLEGEALSLIKGDKASQAAAVSGAKSTAAELSSAMNQLMKSIESNISANAAAAAASSAVAGAGTVKSKSTQVSRPSITGGGQQNTTVQHLDGLLQAARKECEAVEKRLKGVMNRNRKMAGLV